ALKRVCIVILVACAAGDTGRTAEDTTVMSLSEFFAPGIVFQDRNGDGAVDFVNARIVLPEHPTAGELAAAADVAARLGFETSAMDLPLDARPARSGNPQPSIFVGARSLAASGLNAAVVGGSVLKTGEGVVAAFKASGQPSI